MHISSLPSRFGIGDLGPQAYQFADLLVKNLQHFWQILPLNPTELHYGNSPYHSCTTFAGNPLLISLEWLYQDGLLEKKDLNNVYIPEQGSIDFTTVSSVKGELLTKACHFFEQLPSLQQEYHHFCQQQAFWLDDYALFKVLCSDYPGIQWNHWPAKIRDRDSDTLQAISRKMVREIRMVKIIQFLFFRQWDQLKKYCQQKNIKMIGDLPIYVTYHSADVWTYPELFKLDRNKQPLFQAGVPPDYFSKTGQLWGNPVYQWSAHHQEEYRWWMQRIRHHLSLIDLLRIDHFRGLVSFWEIPAGEHTAVHGTWTEGAGDSFFRMLTLQFPDLPFIAEDLGVITEEVTQEIERLGIPGMRVLLFAFDERFPHNTYLPHYYRENCVVYTGTHDNNTIKGWLQKELKPAYKKQLKQYLGKSIRIANAHWDIIRIAQASVANLAIIPVQDILGLGEDARMNNPASTRGNWHWRLTDRQMSEIKENALPRLKEITHTYGREKTIN